MAIKQQFASEVELDLPSLWFTGAEWAEGTAARITRQQYEKRQSELAPKPAKPAKASEPDWTGECSVCGASPTVPETGMCGPCTFGEADTVGGNW